VQVRVEDRVPVFELEYVPDRLTDAVGVKLLVVESDTEALTDLDPVLVDA
jgi:hypothetical protein